jgi:hypothetical protein
MKTPAYCCLQQLNAAYCFLMLLAAVYCCLPPLAVTCEMNWEEIAAMTDGRIYLVETWALKPYTNGPYSFVMKIL